MNLSSWLWCCGTWTLNSHDMEFDLAAMASDPDIQTEIAAINKEFAVTEMDGLEKL